MQKNSEAFTRQKAEARARGLSSMLTSFKIEGVEFSQKQIASLKSRLQFRK